MLPENLYFIQFYAVSSDINSQYDDKQHLNPNEEDKSEEEKWQKIFELILYPELKKTLKPQKVENDKERLFVKVTSLPELYKVFERC